MSKKKRLQKIRNILLEMGGGKFFYRVERSGKNDNVEALISVVNMMSEEIEEALVHQGYANANETIRHIVLMSFVMDSKGCVKAVNSQTCTLLYYSCEEIIGRHFSSFLAEGSVLRWTEHWEHLQRGKVLDTSLELTFTTNEGLLIPGACYVTLLQENESELGKVLLTVVKHSKKQVELEEDLMQQVLTLDEISEEKEVDYAASKKEKIRLTYDDIRKIEKARDLLIDHLDKDFPPIKDFALEVGTNTFKLKYGFKELYGVSVFRYLRNERLRKAKMLVQNGDRPFKTIAQLCGFKSVPHFTRTFKDEFGYTPTALRKKSLYGDS